MEVCPRSGADRHVQHRRRRLALRRDASATSATGISARESNHRANTPSTSTTSSTTLMPRTSLDDTASFSLPPSTPPRPYHQPGSDDSRPCSPQTCGTSTTVTGADRTNNMCESWNSAFQRLVGHQHQGEWTLLRCLRKDAAVVSTLIVQESRGMPPRKRQKRVEHRSPGAPGVLVRCSRSRKEDGGGDVGRCRSPDLIVDGRFVERLG